MMAVISHRYTHTHRPFVSANSKLKPSPQKNTNNFKHRYQQPYRWSKEHVGVLSEGHLDVKKLSNIYKQIVPCLQVKVESSSK